MRQYGFTSIFRQENKKNYPKTAPTDRFSTVLFRLCVDQMSTGQCNNS